MRSINNIQSTLTWNNNQIAFISNQRLIQQWEEWARNAEPGVGEVRDIALHRLIDYLERHSDCLDFVGLKLTELPANLPAGLRNLNVSNNQLTYLPEVLPLGLNF